MTSGKPTRSGHTRVELNSNIDSEASTGVGSPSRETRTLTYTAAPRSDPNSEIPDDVADRIGRNLALRVSGLDRG